MNFTPDLDKRMKAVLKKVLVPGLKARGFAGRYPEFQRKAGEKLHLVSVQFYKYGGRFIIEAAHHPAGDLVQPWGEVVPESKITVPHTLLVNRARLKDASSCAGSNKECFAFEHFGQDDSKYEAIAEKVMELFPQVERWLNDGTLGDNLDELVPNRKTNQPESPGSSQLK